MTNDEYVTRRECELTHTPLVEEFRLLRLEVNKGFAALVEGQEKQNGAIAANTKWRVQGQVLVAVLWSLVLAWGGIVIAGLILN